MFEIYTFYQNTYEICAFYMKIRASFEFFLKNWFEIYLCILNFPLREQSEVGAAV